jgi:predicted transcriptional regulator of viral defense system
MKPRSRLDNTPTPSPRQTLALLARGARAGVVSVPRAAEVLKVPPRTAAILLARLTRRGWLSRVRRGLYLVLPLEAVPGTLTPIEDPWILAREIFSPCYIGGWTAAEHWGLTEQIFRSTFVVTAAHVRRGSATLLGAEFHLVRVPASRVRGIAAAWRGRERVPVADRERTLADALLHPEWVGGIRHLAEMLTTYRESGESRPSRLVETLGELGRGAAFKRLGYLAETLWPEETDLIEAAYEHRSAGLIALDPSVRTKGRINKRWGLRINASIDKRGRTT